MNLKPFLFLFLLACLIAPAAAAGGAGTAANPYIIQTPAELQSIQNNLGAYYRLANDIDLSGVTWTPIGSMSAPFTGQLDGNGKTLSNLNLNSQTANTGLFGAIGTGATIKNIIITDFSISTTGTRSGIVSGTVVSNSNSVTFDNIRCVSCSLSSSNSNSGIIVGSIASPTNILNCVVDSVYLKQTNNYNGGVVGLIMSQGSYMESCTISNSIFESVGNLGTIGYIYSSASLTANDIIINNCIFLSDHGVGVFVCNIDGTSTLNADNINVNGCSSFSRNAGGIVYSIGSSTSGIITNCIVSDCSLINREIVGGLVALCSRSGVFIDCTVKDSNFYGTTIYDIGPSGSYDSTSTATGITNVADRYLYASGLSYTTSGTTATLTLDDRQGAAVIQTDTGAAAAMTWDYGDGTTETDADSTQTHTYANGIYSAGVVMSSYLATTEQAFYTTPINIGIPTYTANTVITQDADIVIDAGQLYQAELQYVLPGTNTDLEFFADNLFIIASGNAVYSVDTSTQEITPISTTTGNTADKIYLGENAAIITDINGNTAVYQYEENSFDYLASGNSQQIAATGNYAGVLLNGKLNIYDLTEPRKIGDVTASVSQLAANDYADTFAGFTGTTLNYWWIENGEIKSGSQTLTNTITAIKQIPQTQNYILTTTKNTVIVGISATGTYSLVSTSDTELPLTHPQATTIGVVIGVHSPNEIYIVGADGSTAGTYQTGATLNDASITKATGLFAITGGNDQQAYVLRKDQSSTWTLAQTITANGVLSHTQISTTGGYAAIVSGVNMYLLKRSSTTDANNYYLQGVIIESNGKLYSGSFTINGEKVTTDTTGKFIYQVTPGNLYKITVQGTTTEYTASNAALQQIAIRIKAGLLSTEVTYNAEYSAEAQAIVMSYDDSAGKTTAVNWNVYETANNTLVATYTGNSASFPVAPGDVYNNYYVQLSADRGAATVANTWSITPAGGQPVNLYGLDEDGRNIIFGFLLLLLAGLFGVMHSRSGAIIVALGACVMRYLELITIPWILITIAAVLAIVAAIAHGGQNR